jgi:hypothetical protein
MAEAFEQCIAYVLCAPTALMLAAAADEFVIKPVIYDKNSCKSPPVPEQSSPQSSRSRGDFVGALATIVLLFVTIISSVLRILYSLNVLEMG